MHSHSLNVVAARHLVFLICCVPGESETRDFDCGCFGMLPRPLYFPYQSSYSRRRPRNRRSSRRPKPEYERNIVSAFFALASAVLLAIAEAEPKWLHIVSGKCEGKFIGMYKVIAYKHPEELSKFGVSISCFRLIRVLVEINEMWQTRSYDVLNQLDRCLLSHYNETCMHVYVLYC